MRRIIKNIYLFLRRTVLVCLPGRKRVTAIDPDKVDTVLLIRLDRIGDLVSSIPAIQAIKKIFPRSRITLLLSRPVSDLAKLIPEIDETIVYRGFFPALSRLRDKNFFLVVDFLMDYTLKTAMLGYLIGGKVVCGFDIESRGRLFNAGLPVPGGNKPMSGYLLDLVKLLAELSGKDKKLAVDVPPVLTLTREAELSAAEFLKENGFSPDQKVFGIAPGAKFPSQCWDEQRFAALGDRITGKYGARVVLIGSRDEGEKLQRVASLMRNKPAVAAGMPLDELAGIISCCQALVCNNSGPLHLAAALHIPTVSTMGPTVPGLWMPQGDNHVVIRKDLACSPCNKAFCRSHECMDLISVDEMAGAVDMVMERAGKIQR